MKTLFFFLFILVTQAKLIEAQTYRRPAVLDEFTPVINTYTPNETNSYFLFDEKNATTSYLIPILIIGGIISGALYAGFRYRRSQNQKQNISNVESLEKYRASKKKMDSETKKAA